jgi:hypothetical protein
MGWWKAHPVNASLAELQPGFEDTEHLWGDGPADIMDTAIEEIREQFRLSIGREPMLSELLAGVRFSSSIIDELTPEGSPDVSVDETMMDRCNEIN